MSGLRLHLSIGDLTLLSVQLFDRENEEDGDDPVEDRPAAVTSQASDGDRRWGGEGQQGDPAFQSTDGRHDPGPPYESRRRGGAGFTSDRPGRLRGTPRA